MPLYLLEKIVKYTLVFLAHQLAKRIKRPDLLLERVLLLDSWEKEVVFERTLLGHGNTIPDCNPKNIPLPGDVARMSMGSSPSKRFDTKAPQIPFFSATTFSNGE